MGKKQGPVVVAEVQEVALTEFQQRLLEERVERVDLLNQQLAKMCFAVNGGSLIAVLALIAQLRAVDATQVLSKSMAWAGGFFLGGLFCAIGIVFWDLVAMLSLTSPDYSKPEKKELLRERHRASRQVSSVCFFMSMVFFMAGAFKSYWALI